MIQGTLPSKEADPEIHMLVLNHQIHRCMENCLIKNKCKYFYPRPQNMLGTRWDANIKRMIYQCVNPQFDQYVVPYVRDQLRLLQSNSDIQICHSMQIILYCSKYITKQSLKTGDQSRKIKRKTDPAAQILKHQVRTLQAVFYLSGETDARKGVTVYHIV